jgi:hypothetical protein
MESMPKRLQETQPGAYLSRSGVQRAKQVLDDCAETPTAPQRVALEATSLFLRLFVIKILLRQLIRHPIDVFAPLVFGVARE